MSNLTIRSGNFYLGIALFTAILGITGCRENKKSIKHQTPVEIAEQNINTAREEAMKAQLDYETSDSVKALNILNTALSSKDYYLKAKNIKSTDTLRIDSLKNVDDRYAFLCQKVDYAQLKYYTSKGILYQEALNNLKIQSELYEKIVKEGAEQAKE